MRAASVKEIKTELESQPQQRLLELCLRLAKFKKENKELLTYLLFEEGNENSYIESVKAQVDIAFLELNIKSLYIAKKNLRKILRLINRYIKYSGVKTTEATLLMYYLSQINASGLEIKKSQMLTNIYTSQLKKIRTAIETMHEDLQYDYKKELDALDVI